MRAQSVLVPIGQTEYVHKRAKRPGIMLVFTHVNKMLGHVNPTLWDTFRKYIRRGVSDIRQSWVGGIKSSAQASRHKRGDGPVNSFTTIRMLRRAVNAGFVYKPVGA